MGILESLVGLDFYLVQCRTFSLYQTNNCRIYHLFFFSFSEASFGASQFFQVIVGGNMPLDCGRGLATVGSLKGNISCGNVSKVIFLSFQ